MLVKFDHLTYAANRKSVRAIIERLMDNGYRLTLQEDQANNMPIKLAYMQYKDATHGLHFMAPPEGNGIPVEIVSYENTSRCNSCVEYKPGELFLTIKTKDVESCKTMLIAIGCELNGDGNLLFSGALDDHSFIIQIEKANDVVNNLDNEGICCPTVFVRPLMKTKAKLEQAGVACSEIETFKVQDTQLYVFFAQGIGGEIIEITSNKL